MNLRKKGGDISAINTEEAVAKIRSSFLETTKYKEYKKNGKFKSKTTSCESVNSHFRWKYSNSLRSGKRVNSTRSKY